MTFDASAQTNVGKVRQNNEDNICINDKYMVSPVLGTFALSAKTEEGVFAVCDGMGGEDFGEFASLCGVSAVAKCYGEMLEAGEALQEEIVGQTIRQANQLICDKMQENGARIGSTFALLCIQNNTANLYNIGDSRIYLFRNNILSQLSLDHTVVRQKIAFGAITKEEAERDPARHTLTQHLGIFESELLIEAYHDSKIIQPKDIFLLCSDGLTDMLPDSEIADILAATLNADSLAEALIQKALEKGGKDNVSVVVITTE